MDVSIITIGNSKGIRLEKSLLDKYNITDTVELVLEDDYIKLVPKVSPRKGWDEAFKQMHAEGNDTLIIDDIFVDESFD